MFVVPTKRGRFEIRESQSTPRGPRSRTLASFAELTDEVIEKALARSSSPAEPADVRRAARRAGAPVARSRADRAARELIAELGMGREPDPKLRRLLAARLEAGPTETTTPSSPSSAMAEWMAATLEDRGRALQDLLLLADALPSSGRRGKPLRFPRLASRVT